MNHYDQDQLAIKAIYMQRDYSNAEIAELLDVRLEDLTTALEDYRKKQLAGVPAVAEPVKKKTQPKTRKKKK